MCVFEDAQLTLVLHFANSYGFDFEKNAAEFQSILQLSLLYITEIRKNLNIHPFWMQRFNVHLSP